MENTYNYELNFKLISSIKNNCFQNLDALKKDCEELITLSEKKNDSYGKAVAHIYLAHYYQIVQHAENYRFHLEKARVLNIQNNFIDISMEYNKAIGIYLNAFGDEISALSYYLKGLSLAIQLNDFSACASFNKNIAKVFYQNGAFPEAYQYFLQALESLNKSEKRHPLNGDFILINLIEVSCELKDIQKAKHWYTKAKKTIKSETLLSSILKGSEVHILVLEGKIEEALLKMKEIRKELSKQREEDALFIQEYLNLMNILLIIKQKEDATWCLKKLMFLFNKLNNNFKLKIQSLKLQYNETFKIEEDDAYQNFYEIVLENKKVERASNYESLTNLIHLHFANEDKIKILNQEKKLQKMINLDELTGVFNRRYFSKLISKYSNDKTVKKLGIIMVDVDYFKEYNDTYGHAKGDIILKNIAKFLSEELPKNIYVARFGGDEFSCICIDKEDYEIISFIERVQEKVKASKFEHKTHKSIHYISLSFGFYNGQDRNNILEKADEALYKAKNLGRNTYSKY